LGRFDDFGHAQTGILRVATRRRVECYTNYNHEFNFNDNHELNFNDEFIHDIVIHQHVIDVNNDDNHNNEPDHQLNFDDLELDFHDHLYDEYLEHYGRRTDHCMGSGTSDSRWNLEQFELG